MLVNQGLAMNLRDRETRVYKSSLKFKYPAWTKPAIPVLGATRNPPVNTTAGTLYNHEYSVESLGPKIRVTEIDLFHNVET